MDIGCLLRTVLEFHTLYILGKYVETVSFPTDAFAFFDVTICYVYSPEMINCVEYLKILEATVLSVSHNFHKSHD